MVFRMELTYDKIIDTLDIKYAAGLTNGYSLPRGSYEINERNWM